MLRIKSGGLGLAAITVLLSGCGGSGGSSGAAPTAVTPAATTTTTTTTTTSTTTAPAPAPAGTTSGSGSSSSASTGTATSWASVSALYDAQPDIDTCRTGTLKQAVRDDVLARLNAIRALHRLPAVTYASADETQAAQASLIMAANNVLTHTPASNLKCWTQAGSDGAGSGNLVLGTSRFLVWDTEDSLLAGWLDEVNNANVDNVGHRRWLLDPFLGKIAYGRVAQVLADGTRVNSATVKVFNFTGGVAVPADLPDFVAYPFGDYPARYFDTRALLSFSVVSSKTNRFGNNNVNFANAAVSMTGPSGGSIAVSKVSYDNNGYGIANNIQWAATGLTAGASYTVTIGNVLVAGVPRSYTYSFRIVS